MVRKVARWLVRLPFLKKKAKWAYLFVNQIVGAPKISQIKKELRGQDIKLISFEGKSTFFGYYDKSPANKDHSEILFCATILDTSKKPRPYSPVDILLYNVKNESIRKLGETVAFNWQQGCRLHWINQESVIFNDFCKQRKRYISRVFSVNAQKEPKTYDLPVQDSFVDQYFLSINYRRLRTMRPDYGYFNLPSMSEYELKNLKEDGIWRVEYDSKISKLIISIQQLLQVDYKDTFKEAFHWVNHLMISPDGKRFVFLHRFIYKKRKYDRLFIADSNGENIRLLPSNEMVSHYSWVDNKSIVAYMRNQEGKDGYYTLDVDSEQLKPFEENYLKYGDGHPSYDKEIFITDTYPDKNGFQKLIEVNSKTQKKKTLATFHHPLKFFGETRCDLHPRIVADRIYFDTATSGKRQFGWIEK